MAKKLGGKDRDRGERGGRAGAKKLKSKTRTGSVKSAEVEEMEEEEPRRTRQKTEPLELDPEPVPDLEIGVGDTATMQALDEDPVVADQNDGAIDPGLAAAELQAEFEQPSATARRLTCTKCHADFEVDLSQVGKEIICPTCNNRFLLTSKDIQKQVELLTQQVGSLRVQLEQATQQINHFQTLAQSNRSKLEQAVAAGREVDAERERLANELDKVQRQGLGGRAGPAVDEMRARLDTVEAQRKSLEGEVKELRGKLQKQENRTGQLEADNNQVNVELQLLRGKLAAAEQAGGGASAEDLGAAKADLAKAKSKIADLEHRIRDLDDQVDHQKSATVANEGLQKKLAEVEKQLAAAKSHKTPSGPSPEQVQELKERIGELEEVANQRRDEIARLKDDLGRSKSGTGDLDAALEKARRRNQEQADEIADLQRKLKAALSSQADKDAASGKSTQEAADLRSKLAERDRTISEMNQKLHVKSEQLETAGRDLQEKARVLGERESRLQELHGNLSRRENEIRELQGQLGDKDRQIADKLRHLGTVQQKVHDLEKALEEAGRNRAHAGDDQHKLVLDLKSQLADAERQAAHAEREHSQEVVKSGRELRDALKQVGSLEGELEGLKQRLAAATTAARGAASEEVAPLKARIADLSAALDQERANVMELKRSLTRGSDRKWEPVATHLTHNFGVFRVGGAKDDHEYFDVLFPRGTALPKPGELLTVKRPAYRPKHNLGNMQFLLAQDVHGDQPAGDVNKMHKIVFPFDKTIDPSGRYGSGDTKILSAALDLEIVETYFCNHEGVVTCEFERQSDGKIMRWSFSLVTLKSTN